jgi:hypothetical protein
LLMVKDIARCPTCGSREIVYTCEPKCCFNHVCSECRTSFQLVTRKCKGERQSTRVDLRLPESGEPTVACATCESLRVYALAGASGKVACADCGGLLELVYDEVSEA